MKKNSDLTLNFIIVSNLIRRTINESIPKEMRENLTETQIRIIRFLDKNRDVNIYQKNLEEYFQVRPSTISANLNVMIKNGLIVKEQSEKDSRLKKIVLTNRANLFLKEINQKRALVEEKIMSNLTDDELNVLENIIEKIKNSLK